MKLFSYIIVVLLFMGCTTPTKLYVVNKSESDLIIQFTTKDKLHSEIHLLYKREYIDIDNISFRSDDKFYDTLNLRTDPQGKGEIILPSNSSLLLEKSYNMRSELFSSMRIRGQKVVDSAHYIGMKKTKYEPNLGITGVYLY